MDDFTRKFDAAQDKDEQIHFILTSVYEALKEKGLWRHSFFAGR